MRQIRALLIATVLSAAPSATGAAEPMAFEIVSTDLSCGECTTIFASGEIVQSTLSSFRSFLAQHHPPLGTTVVLNSPGGSLFAGLELGSIIRSNRLHTSVYARDNETGGYCASACAYAFLGGVHRTVAPAARFGLHQFSSDEPIPDAVANVQGLVSFIAGYVREAGASSRVVEIASAIPPHEMLWLGSSDLFELGITTSRGTRYSPEWTVRSWDTSASLSTEALQDDGAVVRLRVGCPVYSPTQLARRPYGVIREDDFPLTISIHTREDGPSSTTSPSLLASASVVSAGTTRQLFAMAVSVRHDRFFSEVQIFGWLTAEQFDLLRNSAIAPVSIVITLDAEVAGRRRFMVPRANLAESLTVFRRHCDARTSL